MKINLHSLVFKLGLTIFWVAALSFASLGLYCTLLFSKQIDEQLLVQSKIPGQLMNQQALPYSTARDRRALSNLVGDEVLFAAVTRSDKRIHYCTDRQFEGTLINSSQYSDDTRHQLHSTTALFADNIPLGELHLRIDTRRSLMKKLEVASVFFFGGLLCILITTWVGTRLTRRLTMPRILSAARCLRRVTSGEFSVRIDPADAHDELGMLERGINRMVQHLEMRQHEDIRLTAQLEFAKDAAENAARSKGEFLANMSHEIRTPLNAVLGYAQIISRECKDCPRQEESISSIIQNGRHLLELINDILEIARTDTHAPALTPSDFDFFQLLESLRVASVQRRNNTASIDVSHNPNLPRFLYADKLKIRQVLINLIGNAVKFTDKGHVYITTGLNTTNPDDDSLALYVDVEDTGCGIDPGSFESIFNPFEQASSHSRSGEGTGLGLALSRRYAQAMGGNVILRQSTLGKGSTFRFTFMANPSAIFRVNQNNGTAPVCRLAPGQGIPHILLIDGNDARRQMIDTMLKEVGFSTETVPDETVAAKLLYRGNYYDLILMDQPALKPNSTEIIKQLRDAMDGNHVPIVLISDSLYQDNSSSIVAEGVVSKPIDREHLLAEIRRLTGIQYEHDALPSASRRKSGITPKDLQIIPLEHLCALRQALKAGRIHQMRSVVKDISRGDPSIATELTRLINQYDYEKLTRLLED